MNPSQPAAGPAPLGVLLSETFAYCKAHWQSLALGIAVFGVVMGIVSASVAAKAGDTVLRGMDQMGIDADRMDALSDRIEAGDETAMAELEQMLAGEFDGLNEEQMARKMMGPIGGVIAEMAPVIGVSMLVSWFLSLLALAYYSLVAVEGKDVGGTMARLQKAFLPLFGVNLWAMLRSFIWIPILGLIPAIILGPRFVAAPLIHLVEGKGVTASVSDSYRRTRGYWGKIVGNAIVAMLIMVVVSAVVNIVLSLLLASVPMATLVANQVISQVTMAFMTVFSVRLAHTIVQHPRA